MSPSTDQPLSDPASSWQQAIYTVDDQTAAVHTPVNKGHEAMAYLTYIIDNYDGLPATAAFIHSHRGGYLSWWSSWHTDAAAFDNVASLRTLQIEFVQRNGYANLRCATRPGCTDIDVPNTHVTPEVWAELFPAEAANTSSPSSPSSGRSPPFPSHIAAACCAQFAVSRDRVRARRREDYVGFRDWLLRTQLADRKSGRVFEFLWHFIFGMDAVYCPDRKACYCDVYGRC